METSTALPPPCGDVDQDDRVGALALRVALAVDFLLLLPWSVRPASPTRRAGSCSPRVGRPVARRVVVDPRDVVPRVDRHPHHERDPRHHHDEQRDQDRADPPPARAAPALRVGRGSSHRGLPGRVLSRGSASGGRRAGGRGRRPWGTSWCRRGPLGLTSVDDICLVAVQGAPGIQRLGVLVGVGEVVVAVPLPVSRPCAAALRDGSWCVGTRVTTAHAEVLQGC